MVMMRHRYFTSSERQMIISPSRQCVIHILTRIWSQNTLSNEMNYITDVSYYYQPQSTKTWSRSSEQVG